MVPTQPPPGNRGAQSRPGGLQRDTPPPSLHLHCAQLPCSPLRWAEWASGCWLVLPEQWALLLARQRLWGDPPCAPFLQSLGLPAALGSPARSSFSPSFPDLMGWAQESPLHRPPAEPLCQAPAPFDTHSSLDSRPGLPTGSGSQGPLVTPLIELAHRTRPARQWPLPWPLPSPYPPLCWSL